MDRLTSHLAENIPERYVNGGEAPHLGAAAAEPDIGRTQDVRMFVDAQRGFAEKIGCRAFMDVGGHGVAAEEGLAKPDGAVICQHMYPDKVGKFGKLDGLDRRDLHVGSSEVSRLTPALWMRSPAKFTCCLTGICRYVSLNTIP